MSQDEVLRCLYNLGGSATLDELTDEYNKMHFPRNVEYKQLSMNEVKKTQQGDISKLLRDGLIKREYKKPSKRDAYKAFRKYGFYSITEYGYNYIDHYKLVEITMEPLEVGNRLQKSKPLY